MRENLREALAGIKRTSNPLHCPIDPCPRGEDCFECELDRILAAAVEAVKGMQREEADHLFRYNECYNCHAEMFKGFQATIVRLLQGEGLNAAGDTTAPPAKQRSN